MRFLTLALALLTTTACGGEENQPGTEVTDPRLEPGQVEVAHFRLPCQGEARQLCLQVRAFGEPDFSLFYSEIEGFDFTWGVRTVLAVREEPIAQPAADGSDRRYILEAIIDEEVDREAFELPLGVGDFAVQGPQELRLLDGTTAACASVDLCRVITARMGEPSLVRARAGSNPGDPLSFFRVM